MKTTTQTPNPKPRKIGALNREIIWSRWKDLLLETACARFAAGEDFTLGEHDSRLLVFAGEIARALNLAKTDVLRTIAAYEQREAGAR